MATVRNATKIPLPLTSGGVIAPGDAPVNVDVEQPLEASLLTTGKLVLVDGSIVPPAPVDPLASKPGAFYAGPSQPVGMPVGSFWLNTTTGELFRVTG